MFYVVKVVLDCKIIYSLLKGLYLLIGKGMQSNTTVSVKVYLMAILDNYMFRPLLVIFRLSSVKAETCGCLV